MQGPPQGSSIAGFTLIEMMVVLMLVAIMSAMILPEMKGTLEEEALHGTGRKIIHGLNLAYSQSVTLNRPHQVRIDMERGLFQVERRSVEADQPAGFEPVPGLPGSRADLDGRIRIRIRTPPPIPDDEAAAPAGETGFSASRELESDSDGEAGDGSGIIRFYPDGTADRRDIELRDRSGFGLVIRINPVTSRVRVVKLERQ